MREFSHVILFGVNMKAFTSTSIFLALFLSFSWIILQTSDRQTVDRDNFQFQNGEIETVQKKTSFFSVLFLEKMRKHGKLSGVAIFIQARLCNGKKTQIH